MGFFWSRGTRKYGIHKKFGEEQMLLELNLSHDDWEAWILIYFFTSRTKGQLMQRWGSFLLRETKHKTSQAAFLKAVAI